MAAIIAAGVTAAAGLMGGVMADKGTKRQNIANAKQAALNRKFQERMSSTAHQREVGDLRAAGLNPILSAMGKGASTPGGAQAQMLSEKAGSAKALSTAAQDAANIALTISQTKKTDAETDNIAPKAALNAELLKGIQAFIKWTQGTGSPKDPVPNLSSSEKASFKAGLAKMRKATGLTSQEIMNRLVQKHGTVEKAANALKYMSPSELEALTPTIKGDNQ